MIRTILYLFLVVIMVSCAVTKTPTGIELSCKKKIKKYKEDKLKNLNDSSIITRKPPEVDSTTKELHDLMERVIEDEKSRTKQLILQSKSSKEIDFLFEEYTSKIQTIKGTFDPIIVSLKEQLKPIKTIIHYKTGQYDIVGKSKINKQLKKFIENKNSFEIDVSKFQGSSAASKYKTVSAKTFLKKFFHIFRSKKRVEKKLKKLEDEYVFKLVGVVLKTYGSSDKIHDFGSYLTGDLLDKYDLRINFKLNGIKIVMGDPVSNELKNLIKKSPDEPIKHARILNYCLSVERAYQLHMFIYNYLHSNSPELKIQILDDSVIGQGEDENLRRAITYILPIFEKVYKKTESVK